MLPAILETTAPVYPGGSGGTIVNPNGPYDWTCYDVTKELNTALKSSLNKALLAAESLWRM